MMKSQGKFIVLEGVDGSGKTTQVKLLAAELRRLGVEEVVETRNPTGGEHGRRAIELAKAGEMAEAGRHFHLDRLEFLREVVEPALARGAWVVCDRYALSTSVYNFPTRALEHFEGQEKEGIKVPDLTVILLPPRSQVRRVWEERQRGGSDDERGGGELGRWERVWFASLLYGMMTEALVKKDPSRYVGLPTEGEAKNLLNVLSELEERGFITG